MVIDQSLSHCIETVFEEIYYCTCRCQRDIQFTSPRVALVAVALKKCDVIEGTARFRNVIASLLQADCVNKITAEKNCIRKVIARFRNLTAPDD